MNWNMSKQGTQLSKHVVNSLFRGFSLKPYVDQHHLFKKNLKWCLKTSVRLQLPVMPPPCGGPDSTYTCVKPCWKEVLTFILLNYSLSSTFDSSEKPALIKTFDKPAAIHLQNQMHCMCFCSLSFIYMCIRCEMNNSYIVTVQWLLFSDDSCLKKEHPTKLITLKNISRFDCLKYTLLL